MTTETKPPTRMGKQELYEMLSNLGYSTKQLSDDQNKSLKRPALLEMLMAHQQGEGGLAVLSSAEENDEIGIEVESYTVESHAPVAKDNNDITTLEELEIPTPSDPGWTQFVLGKFLEDEVDGENPRVEGLRRVAGELVGEIIEEGCDLVAAPTEDNRFRACVKAWGVFLTPEGQQKRFEALADAYSGNCSEDYVTYLVAMADTRAKGRMYRNALCLKRVVSAEEVSKTLAAADDIQQGGAIHTGQISMIRLIADRHNFKISEILDSLCLDYKLNEQTGDVNLQLLSYDDALQVAKKMREMREEKSKND